MQGEFSSMPCDDLEACEVEGGGRLLGEGVYVIYKLIHLVVLQKLTTL